MSTTRDLRDAEVGLSARKYGTQNQEIQYKPGLVDSVVNAARLVPFGTCMSARCPNSNCKDPGHRPYRDSERNFPKCQVSPPRKMKPCPADGVTNAQLPTQLGIPGA